MQVTPGRDYYYRILGWYPNDSAIYSQPVKIFLPEYVEQERGLFLGEALAVPGTIEAEYFDLGGEGKAYHDLDRTNIAGAFRPDEGVDIYDRLGEGYHIGNALPGEWIEYTVDVAVEDDYLMEVYLAAIQSGGKFQITIGAFSSDTLESVSSGSWLQTAPVSEMVHLNAGEQVMRFTIIEEPLFNFDKIVFSLPETTGPDPHKASTGLKALVQPGNRLLLQVSDALHPHSFRIFDIRGRLLFQGEMPPGEHFLSDPVPPGIYIVQVFSDSWMGSDKLIVSGLR
jgi:hypothetical protein